MCYNLFYRCTLHELYSSSHSKLLTIQDLTSELLANLYKMTNNNPNMNIPVTILIFENDGQISYRAYSPTDYFFNEDGSNPDHRSEQFGQFNARVYNRVAYDSMQPLNNATNYGRIKEIHSRHIMVPISQRQAGICYFTTYIHQHCNYKPIHRNSPVFFDANQANNYANMQPNLFHRSCSHEFV
jgi:hypothetical protein